uniref:Protein kinase domain-containing protein n=1 Tax=Strigamia maritima TaxID=126957 RepID=T1JN07_STRMM
MRGKNVKIPDFVVGTCNKKYEIEGSDGNPSFKGETLWIVFEAKSPRVLEDVRDLVEEFRTATNNEKNTAVTNCVQQLLNYMQLSEANYGALTTYIRSWFFHRTGDEAFEVTSSYHCRCKSPTMLECYSSILQMSKNEPSPLDGVTIKSRPGGGGNSKKKADSEKKSEKEDKDDGNARRNSDDVDKSDQPEEQDVDIHIQGHLTESYSGDVYVGRVESVPSAIKVCSNEELWEEIRNEMEIYETLKDLQGTSIPRLVHYGKIPNGSVVLATEFVGHPISPEKLSPSDKEEIVSCLSAIHSLGVCHNDLREENILTDGKRFKIIDFAWSRVNCTGDEFRKENAKLNKILNCC